MAENGVKSFEETMETPSEQHGIVQKLYAELDLEREASATAASEALSMILRLQEEKAAEQMESHQYRRMVEERIHHDEELLATLEELLRQKDMEISSLRSQLKIYSDQVLNSDLSTPSFAEMDTFETPSLRRIDTPKGNLHETALKNFTLPAISFTGMCCEMDVLDEGVCAPQKKNSGLEQFNEFTGVMSNQQGPNDLCKILSAPSVESPALICNRLCDRAKYRNTMMNEKLKSRRLPECNRSHDDFRMPIPVCSSSLANGNMPQSFFFSTGKNSLHDSDLEVEGTRFCTEATESSSLSRPKFLEDFDSSCFSLETELSVKKINCTRFHDIFEVPQCKTDHDCEPKKKLFTDCVPGRRDASSTTYSKSREPWDCNCKDEDCSDEALLNVRYRKLCEGVGLDWNGDCKDPKVGVSFLENKKELWKSNAKQFENFLKFLEHDRKIMKQEDTDIGKEQLKLLREISEQLGMICSQLKRPPSEKYCHQDDSVLPVMEV